MNFARFRQSLFARLLRHFSHRKRGFQNIFLRKDAFLRDFSCGVSQEIFVREALAVEARKIWSRKSNAKQAAQDKLRAESAQKTKEELCFDNEKQLVWRVCCKKNNWRRKTLGAERAQKQFQEQLSFDNGRHSVLVNHKELLPHQKGTRTIQGCDGRHGKRQKSDDELCPLFVKCRSVVLG